MEERHRGFADPIRGTTSLELGYAIVLATEGNEVSDWRIVAAFDVAAEELAALGEAEGVDSGGRADDLVGFEVCAYFFELFV